MCRKLTKLELIVAAGSVNLMLLDPTIEQLQATVLNEMKTIISELKAKWDQPKAQRLWSLSTDKVLIEDPDFKKESKGAKCVLTFLIEMAEVKTEEQFAEELKILQQQLAGTSPTTAPTVSAPVATTPTTSTAQQYYS